MYSSPVLGINDKSFNDQILVNGNKINNVELNTEADVYNYIKNITAKWAIARPKSKGTKKITCSKKNKWTQEEDRNLYQAIQQLGENNWKKICLFVPGRTGKQCRERWMSNMRPNLARSEWLYEEDLILIQKQKIFGNKWSLIAEYLPGRSGTSVKNRWVYLCRRDIPAHSEEYIKIVNTLTIIHNQNNPKFSEDEQQYSSFDELLSDQDIDNEAYYFFDN